MRFYIIALTHITTLIHTSHQHHHPHSHLPLTSPPSFTPPTHTTTLIHTSHSHLHLSTTSQPVQLPPATLVSCLPHLVKHLSSKSTVVHSYAAVALEKLMAMRPSWCVCVCVCGFFIFSFNHMYISVLPQIVSWLL